MDVASRARRLAEAEREAEQRREARQQKEAEDLRFRAALKRIKQQDREIEREQARKEAEAEAQDLAARRYELAGELEDAAANLNRLLGEYEDLDARHRAALRAAGQNPGHSNSLHTLIPRWIRHRLGGFRALSGIPGTHPSGRDRTLADRDALASPRVGDGAA